MTAQASIAIDVRSFSPGPYGGGIAHGADDAGAAWSVLLRSRVISRAPQPGERWRFAGELQLLDAAAKRLEASLALPLAPKGCGIVRYLATNPNIVGVGRAHAQRLWDHFGEELYAVLQARDAATLATVVGPILAASVVCGWGLYIEDVEAFAWLDACGVAPRTAATAIAIWGAGVQSKLADDPYALSLLESWANVDEAALRAGLFPDDDRRLLAAVEEAGARRFARKHTAATLGELAHEIGTLVGRSDELVSKALTLARSSARLFESAPGVFQTRGPREMERAVRELLLERAARPAFADSMLLRQASNTADASGLNTHQREAVHAATVSHVAVLCGGAGTGKTTTLKAIIATLKTSFGQDYPVHQVALAGRAARRMAEATGHEATTAYRFTRDVRAGRVRLDTGLLIVDEASMIDLPTAYGMLRNISSNTRLLFVGDPAQLPPIGPGLVFHRMVDSRRIPRVELTEVHRQRGDTGIPHVGALVRAGQWPHLQLFDLAEPHRVGVFLHPASSASLADATLRVFEAIAGDNFAGGVRERDVQLLCATRRGSSGTYALNDELERRHLPRTGLAKAWGLAVGSKVLWAVNDHQRGTPEAPRALLNGMLGTVTALAPDHIDIEFDDGTVDAVGHEDLAKLERGWAISVHKAQGSAFQHVVIPIVGSRLLDRMLVYTAVTRAIRSVILVGDAAQLRAAIENEPNAMQRRVALSF